MAKNNETAVATQQGLGFGGLGDLNSDSFKDSLGKAGEQKGSATADDVRAAMGNRQPKMPKLTVKHQGACIFVTEDEKKHEELVGVIVAHTYHNTFYSKSFDEREEGALPPCSSNDGTTITEKSEDPQATGCNVCPRNRDASARDARQAAFNRPRGECCNNYLSLAFALPGEEVPAVVRFPATSFKAWAEYVQKIASIGRYRPHEVASKITLRNKKREGGAETSIAVFELLGELPESMRGGFQEAHDNYTAVLRRHTSDEQPSDDNRDAAEAVAEAKRKQEEAAAKGAAL